MAFISTMELTGRNSSTKRMSLADVMFATDLRVNTERRTSNHALRISISAKIAKEARIINGDRVDLMFDKESTPQRGLIKRVTVGGWAMTLNSKRLKNSRLVTRVGLVKGMPTVPDATDCNAIVTEEGILFDLPASCSFDKIFEKTFQRSARLK